MRYRAIGIAGFLVLLLLGSFRTSAVVAGEPNGKVTLDMALDLVLVDAPQISPDGAKILYTRRTVDKVNDRFDSDLWIMDADGTHQRFFAKGSGGRWSPDSKRIAYVAPPQPKTTPQIFVRWLGAASGSQITTVDQAPSALTWSPDGKRIAFAMMVPAHNRSFDINLPGKPKGAIWTQAPRIVERLVYQSDGRGFLSDEYRHIFVVSADGGTPRQLTTGDWNDGAVSYGGGSDLSWTPDGSEILFSGLRSEDFEYRPKESYIYAVQVDSGDVRQLISEKGVHRNPTVSPNGKYVAYVGAPIKHEAYTTSHLYVMNLDGSDSHPISSSLDQSPQGPIWKSDSSGVYLNAAAHGTRDLYFATLGGDVRKVTSGNHMLSVSSISERGVAAATVTSYYKPIDIYAFNVDEPQQLKQLTFANDDLFHHIELGKVEEFSYDSFDKLKVEGWIIKPPDFQAGKKYPLVLNIHGGPAGMWNVGFDLGWQWLAAQGYVVVAINPRGSTGYGSAVANGISFDYPGPDYKDLMKGVDTVLARGYVDSRNLFVYGCSGGGVLTSWTVGHTDRFAAAAVECPVTDWLSFSGTTDSINYYDAFFHKRPWEDPGEFLRLSPLMYVNRVKTPTLMIVGMLDRRTPYTQTEEFYEALKLLKVPTAMILMNDQYHGVGEWRSGHFTSPPSNYMRNYLYLKDWFAKYSRH